jgi:transglutaminase-like putative cysteine protease
VAAEGTGGSGGSGMNHKLTATSALAVILASLSLFAVLSGAGWLLAGIGAAIVIALAGTLTRLDPVRAAIAATVLALAGSFPLLSAQSWGLKVAGLAIIAVTAASLTRLKALPLIAGAVTYLAALLIYLDTAFAAGHALAGLIPTGSSLHHLWQVANQGLSMRASAPPVSSTPGVELLAAAGIGAVAIITDLIAVRLRSPAIAGLPLLVLFSVPITTSAKPAGLGSSVTFCLAVIGFLALLAADGRERLRIWGRLVSVWYGTEPEEQSKGPDTRGLAAAGRRIGAAAVCVALVVPLLIPGLRLHGLFAKHDLPGTGGVVGLPAAIDQMHRQLTSATAARQVVLTYTTNNREPAQQYLPLAVTNYDTRSQEFAVVPPGSSTKISRLLPPVPGMDASIPESIIHTQITMSKSVSGYSGGLTFLPVPYAPVEVSIPPGSDPTAWQADNATLTIWSSSAKLAGLSYQVTSNEAEPTAADLNISQKGLPAGLTQYLAYDGPDQGQLTGIARSVTRGAKTAYQQAQDLADWFSSSGGFTYSLQPTWLSASGGLLSNTQQLVDFLTKDKVGYCQQFAYAMAILSRLLGIPSRIAVGYTAGTPIGHHTNEVTEADAHAWPELYFKDVGWTRFEPTPSGTTGQRTATQPDYSTVGPAGAQPGGSQTHLPGQGGSTGPGKSSGKNSVRRIPNPSVSGGGALPLAHRGSVPILPIVAIVLALAAIAPGITRLLVRRGRWRRASGDVALAHAAWHELRDDLHDFGLECRASESPRAIARRVGSAEGLDPDVRAALDRVARAQERACYSTRPEAAGTLRTDVSVVRRALSRQAAPAVRWRSRLLPPSTLAPIRAGLQHSLDLFGWLDAAARQVRRRLARQPSYQQGA